MNGLSKIGAYADNADKRLLQTKRFERLSFQYTKFGTSPGRDWNDSILKHSDFMVISEIWMESTNTVKLNGFKLRARNNTELVRVSAAGGSATYRNPKKLHKLQRNIVDLCNFVLRKRRRHMPDGRENLRSYAVFPRCRIYTAECPLWSLQ